MRSLSFDQTISQSIHARCSLARASPQHQNILICIWRTVRLFLVKRDKNVVRSALRCICLLLQCIQFANAVETCTLLSHNRHFAKNQTGIGFHCEKRQIRKMNKSIRKAHDMFGQSSIAIPYFSLFVWLLLSVASTDCRNEFATSLDR